MKRGSCFSTIAGSLLLASSSVLAAASVDSTPSVSTGLPGGGDIVALAPNAGVALSSSVIYKQPPGVPPGCHPSGNKPKKCKPSP